MVVKAEEKKGIDANLKCSFFFCCFFSADWHYWNVHLR